MRGVVLAVIALTGAMSLVACAKDAGRRGSVGGQAAACKLADKPELIPGLIATTTATGERIDGSHLRVGLAFDVGGRGDESFNDAAAAGIDRAKEELGITDVREVTASHQESEDVKQSRLRQLAQDGFNPIIAVGFSYADSLEAVAPEFPNVRFALVDATVEGAPNVTPLLFSEEQGSFLVGVAAAYKSRNCHVGFVGGVETPLIQKFEAGFLQGAKAAAPDIRVDVKYLTSAGDFSGFNDPEKATHSTRGLLDRGADVIYQAAGGSGKGVFAAVDDADGAMAIGVDSDQYKQKNLAAYRDVIITSMLKRVDVGVVDFLRAVAKNDLSAMPDVLNLKENGVDYATSGGKLDDIEDVLEAYKSQIIAGNIEVRDRPGA
ncbi:BMP family ABC transporter substrate-binding protein [Longimycelium tulufanense]|uniref:BMP family ABC transporter substrate-binding protein n=1 Tax=Longimycelium tulufanense TaxID=907463 RepID=A0A8J3FUK4_9PSEU|nr:BMP family ABC transporter substrate-binding protein [Longimycelium tulufanense]GGM59508.1 BMP family ABC transporter substrate-binding protein [Longimycelium tulufanense]